MPDQHSSESTRFHIDSPQDNESLDASELVVRGWVIGAPTDPVARLEIRNEGRVISETVAFTVRPDVINRHGLPSGSKNGFELQVGAGLTSGRIEVWIGTASGVTERLTSIDLDAFPKRVTPLGELRRRLGANAQGLEIGAHINPVRGVTPFYTDAVAAFVGTAGKTDFLSHATALPLPDGCLDYLCASHVIEHLPNPLAALLEWRRVLKPGALLYLVIPDKRFTFDVNRKTTTARHLLADYRFDATSWHRVAEHVDEFVFETDWSKLRPECPKSEEATQRQTARAEYLRRIASRSYIDIHYHTFTPESVADFLSAAGLINSRHGFSLLASAERYPAERGDGIGLLLQKASGTPTTRPLESFELRHALGNIPPLRMVCPATLSPLRLSTNSAGEKTLMAEGGASYTFVDGLPNLVPASPDAVDRAWNGRWRRELTYWRGLFG